MGGKGKQSMVVVWEGKNLTVIDSTVTITCFKC